jgi:hypothetical protein
MYMDLPPGAHIDWMLPPLPGNPIGSVISGGNLESTTGEGNVGSTGNAAGGFEMTFSFTGSFVGAGSVLFSAVALPDGSYALAGNFVAHRNGATLGLVAQGAAMNFVSAAGAGGETMTGNSTVSNGATLALPGVDKPH